MVALWQDGDCYTEAQCEAMVMCSNNHWIITPNLTRSIQIDPWPAGPKSYLWQPVITSPVIQQTDGRATDSCFSLIGPCQCGLLMVIAG